MRRMPAGTAAILLLAALSAPLWAEQAAEPTAEPASGGGPSLVPFPYVFYSPETSLAGGLILMVVGSSRPGDSDQLENVTRAGGFASLSGQAQLFVNEEYVLPGNTLRLGLDGHVGKIPNKFFGIGPDARSEEDFTALEFATDASVGFLLAPGLYLGPRLRWSNYWMDERDADGTLVQGSVPGGNGAGVISPGFRLTWETRDSPIAPTRGYFAELCGNWSFMTFGTGTAFPSVSLDARAYRLLLEHGRVVLAAQFYGALAGGRPPFQELPRLGGDELLRGYYDGRWRDNALLALQTEIRIPVWWRLGVVFFCAAGQVAPDPLSFTLGNTKLAGGAGIRFLLDEKSGVNVRADVAVGEDGVDFYFNLGEAF